MVLPRGAPCDALYKICSDDAAPQGRAASEQSASSGAPSASMSGPPGFPWRNCLFANTGILCGSGRVAAAASLKPGDKLQSISLAGEPVFGTVQVRHVQVLPPRERDIVSASFAFPAAASEEVRAASIFLTSDHLFLAAHPRQAAWRAAQAKQLLASSEIWAAKQDGSDLSMLSATVTEAKHSVCSCEVVVLQLEDAAHAILAECQTHDRPSVRLFAAVLGSPPHERLEAVWERGFLRVRSCEDTASERMAASDPTADRVAVPPKVYRTILPPHDSTCPWWCRYHFQGKCKNGKLCSRCHHPDHYVGQDRAPRRHGHHGRGR